MSDRNDLVAEQQIADHVRVIDRKRNKRRVDLAMHYLVDKRRARAGADCQFRVRETLRAAFA